MQHGQSDSCGSQGGLQIRTDAHGSVNGGGDSCGASAASSVARSGAPGPSPAEIAAAARDAPQYKKATLACIYVGNFIANASYSIIAPFFPQKALSMGFSGPIVGAVFRCVIASPPSSLAHAAATAAGLFATYLVAREMRVCVWAYV